jgi:PhoPQ-activated pathogenicity-related protein
MEPIKEDITDKLLNKLNDSLGAAYLQNINPFRDNSIRIKLDTDLYYQILDVRSPIFTQLYWDNEN